MCSMNSFFTELGNGQSCSQASECSYGNAVCQEGQCTCGISTYVNDTLPACVQSKKLGIHIEGISP
ncbi:hypothetical protein DPMN_165623 [Dreissena polymorpha]|uniref:EB domain-containing protein n=1 Tax=Dreissena polymorpha TaxID=45954 RepID=A0A9D4EXJ9_DREPO|nr:hypothetical protein DPMN_165623 [Dreissena polymorpha]